MLQCLASHTVCSYFVAGQDYSWKPNKTYPGFVFSGTGRGNTGPNRPTGVNTGVNTGVSAQGNGVGNTGDGTYGKNNGEGNKYMNQEDVSAYISQLPTRDDYTQYRNNNNNRGQSGSGSRVPSWSSATRGDTWSSSAGNDWRAWSQRYVSP